MSTLKDKLIIIQQARDAIRTALAEKGQVVGKDIRDYAQAVSEITTSEDLDEVLTAQEQKLQALEEALNNKGTVPATSGVKLFETIEEMQSDENAHEGDLAVVYREEIQPVTEESEFDSCIFPNEVVLDEAFTSSIYGSFRSTGGGFFDGMVDMSSSNFRFNGWGESSNINVQYTSQDGITYTRTDGGEELQEFGTTIQWDNGMGSFNSVVGNFMKIGGNYFEGLYEYKGYKNEEYAEAYSNVRYTNNDIVFNTTDVYISDLVELIHSKEEDIKSATGMSGEITDISIVKTAENQFTMYTFYGRSSYGQRAGGFILYNNNLYACGDNYTTNIYKFTINISNNTVVYDGEINYDTTITINTYLRYCVLLDNVSPVFLICQSGGTTYRNQRSIIYTSDNIGTNTKTYDIYTPTKATMYEYKLTSTQLDATSDYVYEKTFYGKNGVENGTLSNTISSNFNDVSGHIYRKAQVYYNTLTPIVLTDNNKNINSSLEIIPCKSDGTPLYDTSNITNMSLMFAFYFTSLITIPKLNTSNVTNMYLMFGDCTSLLTISLIDTSNVTNMRGMFNGCTSLISIPQLNTSSVTNMSGMFADCTSLTTIPQLDTSSVTDMGSMFVNCASLTTIPQLNTSSVTLIYSMFNGCASLTTIPQLDTSSVTNMNFMFYGCTSLTTIPVLNTNNVTSMNDTFNNCTSLNNDSLNNILAMCANATKITSNKTLAYIGLTQEQATICTTLSNYSAFTSAGWITGY